MVLSISLPALKGNAIMITIDANIIGALITLIGGAVTAYMRSIAISVKSMEISVAVLAKRVEIVEDRSIVDSHSHAPN